MERYEEFGEKYELPPLEYVEPVRLGGWYRLV
jgi:hypothetical protein